MIFSIAAMFIGAVVGMLLVSIYQPMGLKKKILPDVKNPGLIMKQENVDNGCFRLHPHEVPCPVESDSMNLLSLQHK